MKYTKNIRLLGVDKHFYEAQLGIFAEKFSEDKISCVQYGKQDIRGTESISFVDLEHCIPFQKNFWNKWEMLGFICGFNEALSQLEAINQYKKKEVKQ